MAQSQDNANTGGEIILSSPDCSQEHGPILVDVPTALGTLTVPRFTIGLMEAIYCPDFPVIPSLDKNYRPAKASPATIANFLIEQYRTIQTPGGGVSTFDFITTVACDAVSEGLVTAEAMDRHGLQGNERVALRESVIRCHEEAALLAKHYIERVPELIPEKHHVVAAAEIMAGDTHENVPRASGRKYIEHPREVAAIAHEVFSRMRSRGVEVGEAYKTMVVSMCFLHDAVEEILASSKYYRPDKEVRLTPLVVSLVFQKLGLPEMSQAVGPTLRLLTHELSPAKGGPIWAPTYSDYVLRGSANATFCVVKDIDMTHNNDIEPKYEKYELDAVRRDGEMDGSMQRWAHKSQLYISGMSYLERRIAEGYFATGSFGMENWGATFVEELRALRKEIPVNPKERVLWTSGMVKNFRQYYYGADVTLA